MRHKADLFVESEAKRKAAKGERRKLRAAQCGVFASQSKKLKAEAKELMRQASRYSRMQHFYSENVDAVSKRIARWELEAIVLDVIAKCPCLRKALDSRHSTIRFAHRLIRSVHNKADYMAACTDFIEQYRKR